MKMLPAVVGLFLMICICPLGLATLWYVGPPSLGSDSNPGTEGEPFATIQKGIDTAEHGDTVVVAEGVYSENVAFGGKNITVRGTGPVENTVIDGGAAGAVVTFLGTKNETCVLSGFTIRNGIGKKFPEQSGETRFGGGICGGTQDKHTLASIWYCVITSNVADHGGGLAFCDGFLQGNRISGNSASGLERCNATIESNVVSENGGGGLVDCDGTIRFNAIVENEGDGLNGCGTIVSNNFISKNEGGGLLSGRGTIHNNRITENLGVGVHFEEGELFGNLIVGNQGIGIWCDAGFAGALENNTVVWNSGGGVAGEGAAASLINCIVWGNTPVGGQQLSNCENMDVHFSCVQGGWPYGDGNIAYDPEFIDPDGGDGDPDTFEDNNYRLSPDSPCVDSGMNEVWMWTAFDLDGNPRNAYRTVDMGAYEYVY